MPRPREERPDRIVSDTYAIGYAIPVNGYYRVHVGSVVEYTGLAETKKNVPEVMKRINRLAKRHYEEKEMRRKGIPVPTTGIEQANSSEAPALPSLYYAISLWYEEFIRDNSGVGHRYKKSVLNTIKIYTPPGFDIPLSPSNETHQLLVHHFTTRRRLLGGKNNTVQRHLIIWKRAFTWMIEQGWLLRNPIKQMKIPMSETRPEELRRYERKELAKMMRELERFDPETRYLCLWLRLTGMRIDEAISMRWEHIDSEGILIQGKGRNNKKRIRRFPFAAQPLEGFAPVVVWQRSLQRVLALQRERSEQGLRGEVYGRRARKRRYIQGFVWGCASQSWFRTILTKAKELAEARTNNGMAFHAFRADAEHQMINRAGLPEAYALKIAGHSKRVFKEHYEIQASSKELLNVINRVATEQSR